MTALIKLRKAEREDAAFLQEMLYASIYVPEGAEPPGREILSSPGLAKYTMNWGRPGDFGFIAQTEKGVPVGSVTARLFDAESPGYGYIDEHTPELGIALLKEYRGCGLGTRMLQRLVEEARRRGLRALSLSVDPANPAARLYRRMGFLEAGMSGTSIVMYKKLETPGKAAELSLLKQI